jgi:hypothetical protein
VFYGNHKEHKIHPISTVDVIVLLQILLTFLSHSLTVSQLTIDISKGFLGLIAIGVDGRYETRPEKWFNSY